MHWLATTLAADDQQVIVCDLDAAPELWSACLVVGVPDQQVGTMGFEGRSALRKHFTYLIEVRKDSQGQRWAEVTPTGTSESSCKACRATTP